MVQPTPSAEGISNRVPVTTFMLLIPSVAADFRRTQIQTKRAQVHKAGEEYDPRVHGIDYVATIELRKPASDI